MSLHPGRSFEEKTGKNWKKRGEEELKNF